MPRPRDPSTPPPAQVRAGGRKSDSFPFIPPGEPGIPRSCVTSVLADTLSKARAAPAPRSVSTVVELAVLITAILGCALAYGTWEWGRSLGRAEAREESESQSFGDPVLTAETKRRGEDIARALETYRAKHGAYPKVLRELVPEFLPRINPPVAGRTEWSYGVDAAGTRFQIGFAVGDHQYPATWYTSDKPGEWYNDS